MRRSDLFEDLLRETRKRSYRPSKHVETDFVGEPGEDTEGLTRELWCLFGNIFSRVCARVKKIVWSLDMMQLSYGYVHCMLSSIWQNVCS